MPPPCPAAAKHQDFCSVLPPALDDVPGCGYVGISSARPVLSGVSRALPSLTSPTAPSFPGNWPSIPLENTQTFFASSQPVMPQLQPWENTYQGIWEVSFLSTDLKCWDDIYFQAQAVP